MPVFEVPQSDMENARLGVVYLLANLKVSSSLAAMAKEVYREGAGAEGAKQLKKQLLPADTGNTETFWSTLSDQVKVDFSFGPVGDALEEAKKVLYPQIVQQLGGILASVKSVATGTKKAIDNFRRLARIKELLDGVNIMEGAPSIMAERVTKLVNDDAWDGVATAAVSAAKAAFEGLTAGVGQAVTAIGNAIYALYKFVKRYFERKRIEATCAKAREYWHTQTESGAIQKDAKAFGRWFADVTKESPILAALTLTSGICGDAQRFVYLYPLTLTKWQNDVVDQLRKDAFARAVRGLDKLKRCASRLIREYELNFGSDDKMVAGLLTHGKEIDLIHDESVSGLKAWLFKKSQTSKAAGWLARKLGVVSSGRALAH
jgi:hypothetical protein